MLSINQGADPDDEPTNADRTLLMQPAKFGPKWLTTFGIFFVTNGRTPYPLYDPISGEIS